MKAAALAVLLAAVALLGSTSRAQQPADGAYSASGLYNLANAYARADKPGMAILNYERAALLAPNDTDIQANLEHVRASLHLPPQDRGRLGEIVRFASPTSVAWIGVLGILMVSASVLAGKRSRDVGALRIAGFMVGLAAVGFCAGNAWVQWPKIHAAVVIVKQTPLRVSPVPMGDPLLQLPEAETVSVAAAHEDYVLVRTRGGRSGWVARADIAEVVPSRSKDSR